MTSSQDDVIEITALGKPFPLGMLYNLSDETLVPGFALWSDSEIQKNKSVTPKNSTQFDSTGSESIEDRAKSLNLDISLQLSLLFGLTTAHGSAEYFMASKKLQQHASLTLKYFMTTRFEQLTMNHLATRKDFQTAEFKDIPATHVVIAVLYGAEAFFRFDRELTKEETEEKIQGDLQLAVNVLGKLAKATAGASLTLGDNEHKQFHKIKCSFYGDFKLDINPSTFEEAVRVYSTLPSMLGKNGEHAVPLRVWLYPLSRLGLKTTSCVMEMSRHCSTHILNTLKNFDMIELKCNHLLNEAVAEMFPVTHDNITVLKQTFLDYKKEFMEKIRSLLPLVRKGEKQEKDIDDILEHYEKSPFRSNNLKHWIKVKEEELCTVKAILKQLEGIGVGLLADEDTESVTCFTFSSIEQPDHFLSQLSNYLTGTRTEMTTDSPLTWLTKEIKETMRSKLKLFKKLKNSCHRTKFAMSLKHHEEHAGACIRVYGDECDGAVCFTVPSKPICSAPDAVTHSSITVQLSPACEDSVKRNLEYKINQEEWMCQPLQQKQDKITLTGLNADTVYQIRCTAAGILGHEVTSDVITIRTSKVASSPPDRPPDRPLVKHIPSNICPPTVRPDSGQRVINKDVAVQTECESPSHVVTAVLYGDDSYFASQEGASEKKKEQTFEGEINLNFYGRGGIKMASEKAPSAPEKFTCTFSGDLNLPENLASVRDAISLYTTLPNMLSEKEEKAVPLRLWLYPHCKLESKVAGFVRDINSSRITDISDVIRSLNLAERKCSDLVNDTVAQTFPGFCSKIQVVKKECHCYKFRVMKKVGSLLPSICQGEKESALSELLIKHEESPFKSSTLDRWLEVKEKECSVLKMFLQKLQDIGVDNDNDISDPETDVVCFTFTSVDEPDDFLFQLSDYVRPAAVKKDKEDDCLSQLSDIEIPTTGEKETGIETQNSDIQTWLTKDVTQRMEEQLQLFRKLKMSINSGATKFIISSKHHNLHPGACVMVFKGVSEQEAVCFTSPSKPTCSAPDAVTHCSVTVKLNRVCEDSVKRNLEYKMNQEEEWKCLPVQQDDEEITLAELDADTEYQIRCTAVGQLKYTVTSDIITVQTLKGMHPPADLSAINISSSSVQLCWFCPMRNSGRFVNEYIFEYRNEKSDQWLSRKAPSEDCVFTLDCLVHDTSYVVRISTDCGEAGVSDPSEELLITTKRDWMKIMEEAHERCYFLNDGPPSVYTLNLKRIGSGEFSKYSFGVPSLLGQENKTIILLGATGSGKTTLINGMINYILGVDWEDDYRFKLPNKVISKAQVENQTSEVTAYHIHHMNGFQIPYSLTIIDTPGFGYTRGIVQDKAIADQMCSFLCNQDDLVNIDAVCFVVQPSFIYLTSTQKYIFESVLSMFGNDIKKNIITLTTDGQTPPLFKVLHSDDVQCATFTFNNSAFFAENDVLGTEGNFGQMFWKMGKESMKRFFSYLNSLQTQSLQLTKEVLEERRKLDRIIIDTQSVIQTGLTQLDVIKQTTAEVEQQQSLVDANKDFEEEVDVPLVVQVDISEDNEFATNCLSCDYTCHYPCAIEDNAKKMDCQAMTNGYCTVCPGKCAWIDHWNLPYIWEKITVTEKRTNENLKRQYETALRQKLDAENRKEELEAEYALIERWLLSMVGEITRCLERLAEISLHTDPLSTPGYIDLLIQSEQQEARLGSEKRISELLHVRQQAVILQKIIRQEDLI